MPSQILGNDFGFAEKQVERNLLEIQKNIAHYKVKIIAVTKYFGLDAIKMGYKTGIRDFGESRAFEAIEKINQLPDEIREKSTFHFIGHLQSNKAEKVVQYFDVIHSVDTLKIAQVISKAACSLNKREKILLQVNNAGEAQKFGFTKDSLKSVFKEILDLEGIEVMGLMNIAPLNAEKQELRKLFSDIREFRNELSESFNVELPDLSMGMSNDYEIAVEEGSTMIRVGRKLFK